MKVDLTDWKHTRIKRTAADRKNIEIHNWQSSFRRQQMMMIEKNHLWQIYFDYIFTTFIYVL